MNGKLYLIPTPIAEGEFGNFFPAFNAEIINHIDHYIVEELRTARRFLRYAGIAKRIDELTFLGIEVVPLIGPSSLILALMGSGMNGQNFVFHGYLPVEQYDREKRLKAIESVAVKTGQTQMFIETPYRNRRMADSICKVLQPATRVCIAAGLTSENALLKTQSVSKWRKYFEDERNALDKRPCIFMIGR